MSEQTPFHDPAPAKRKIPAWAMSMFLHAAIVLVLALWIEGRPRGVSDEPDRPVGVAVAHRMADRTEYEITESSEAEAESESEQADAAMEAAAAPPAMAQPVDLAGLLADAAATPIPDARSGLGNAIDASSSTGSGTGDIGGGGPQASTMFFGLSGSGRRFVYVLDRSESMNNHDKRPLRAAKSELIRSLNALGPEQSFQIVFYNNDADFFQPAGQSFWMLPADDSMKRRAEAFIRAIDGMGGTEHFLALQMALQLEPDVIFMLTDARIPQLSRLRLDRVRALASRSGTTIHAVEFGEDLTEPKVSFLKTMAAENGGQYRYIHVGDLRIAPTDGDSL